MGADTNNGLTSGIVQIVQIDGYGIMQLDEGISNGGIFLKEPISLSSDDIHNFSFISLNSYPQFSSQGR